MPAIPAHPAPQRPALRNGDLAWPRHVYRQHHDRGSPSPIQWGLTVVPRSAERSSRVISSAYPPGPISTWLLFAATRGRAPTLPSASRLLPYGGLPRAIPKSRRLDEVLTPRGQLISDPMHAMPTLRVHWLAAVLSRWLQPCGLSADKHAIESECSSQQHGPSGLHWIAVREPGQGSAVERLASYQSTLVVELCDVAE